MQATSGRRYQVIDDFYDGFSYWLTEVAYDKGPPTRQKPSRAAIALQKIRCPNPIWPLPKKQSSIGGRHDGWRRDDGNGRHARQDPFGAVWGTTARQ